MGSACTRQLTPSTKANAHDDILRARAPPILLPSTVGMLDDSLATLAHVQCTDALCSVVVVV